MRLDEVIAGLDGTVVGGALTSAAAALEVTRIDYDSRRVEPGSLFCCLPGEHHDGHDFAAEARERGAVALLVERALDVALPQVQVDDARRAMATVAVTFHGDPSSGLIVVGITGTNGKTTTAQLLTSVLRAAGWSVEVLGTLTGARTTPEAPDLQRELAAWRDQGVGAVVMEVSSHALELHRVDGMRFRVAVFTNLSRDHLDFHDSMEAYFAAKARLFRSDLSDVAVVNLDSPYGRLLRDTAEIETVGFSLADVEPVELEVSQSRFSWRGHRIVLPLAGAFNVSNAVAAAEAARVLGVDADAVATGLAGAGHVPGRFEVVDAGQPFTVVVDYAHTPDGLEQVLATARRLVGGARVTVVFGCGGDRDPSKRPMMGEVAARRADRVVLTADNSRGEQTGAIIASVKEGFDRAAHSHPGQLEPGTGRVPSASELVVEPDRRLAIADALASARPGDIVVVAGKGHETTQTIGDRVEPFDDRQVAREELARLGWAGDAAEGGA